MYDIPVIYFLKVFLTPLPLKKSRGFSSTPNLLNNRDMDKEVTQLCVVPTLTLPEKPIGHTCDRPVSYFDGNKATTPIY